MGDNNKSIQRVSDSFLCTNCGACQVICPKDAINFKESTIGRIYPEVSDKCINCGLCQKVCPSLNNTMGDGVLSDDLIGKVHSLGVGKAVDQKIYLNSQSGGVCTAILKYLFELKKIDGALVCRMTYGEDAPKVEPVIINSIEDLMSSQKSNYASVQLLGTLKQEIKQYSSIAVVGLGCHIEGLTGLEQFFKDIKGKIFCKLGLICDRSLCTTIQNVYASYLDSAEPVKIIWRCKCAPFLTPEKQYKTAPLVIQNSDNRRKVFPNLYRFALKDMFTAPRCRICRDKLNLCSDIMLGDPWGMSEIDWIGGESVMLSRTPRGEDILKDAIQQGYITFSNRPIQELAKGQLIEERKRQVSTYSKAFPCLNPTIPSFLLDSGIPEIPLDKIENAKKEILAFAEREKLTKNEIVNQAKSKVRKAKMQQTLAFRALRKIYHLVKR